MKLPKIRSYLTGQNLKKMISTIGDFADRFFDVAIQIVLIVLFVLLIFNKQAFDEIAINFISNEPGMFFVLVLLASVNKKTKNRKKREKSSNQNQVN